MSPSHEKIILPGSAIGVLGSGQLGRMFAIAARRMGYRVHTFSADSDTPTGQVSDVEIKASYDDVDALRRFAQSVQVVTFEFENVPSLAAQITVAALRFPTADDCRPAKSTDSLALTSQWICPRLRGTFRSTD